MNEKIDSIAKLIIENGLSQQKELIGCSNEEIQKIEDYYNVKLPLTYRLFLEKMGKSAGTFMAGTDFFYRHLFELREWAIELLKESDTDYKLQKNMFVFSMHQGYEFCFFDVSNSHDPEIYQYIEDEKEPSVVWQSFSEYLKDMVQQHLQALS